MAGASTHSRSSVLGHLRRDALVKAHQTIARVAQVVDHARQALLQKRDPRSILTELKQVLFDQRRLGGASAATPTETRLNRGVSGDPGDPVPSSGFPTKPGTTLVRAPEQAPIRTGDLEVRLLIAQIQARSADASVSYAASFDTPTGNDQRLLDSFRAVRYM